MNEAFIEGLGTSVVGILIVFIVLSALCFVLYLLKFVNIYETKRNNKLNKTESINVQVEVQNIHDFGKKSDDSELVAVITATIAATLGTTTDKLLVKSITKAQSWNSVARREQQRNII